MYMFNVSTLYIAPSKAVVGVDPPMKAISMKKKKKRDIRGKVSKFS